MTEQQDPRDHALTPDRIGNPRPTNVFHPDLSVEPANEAEEAAWREWVADQDRRGQLQPIEGASDFYKTTAFETAEDPSVVIRRYNFGAGEFDFNQDKDNFATLNHYLSHRFLPATQFIDTEDMHLDKRYIAAQENVEGRHYKDATLAAQEGSTASTLEEALELYGDDLAGWPRVRGQLLLEGMEPSARGVAQAEAERLSKRLAQMEAVGYVVKLLDFVVTDKGQIKLTDVQVHRAAEYQSPEHEAPQGSRDIALAFGLEK